MRIMKGFCAVALLVCLAGCQGARPMTTPTDRPLPTPSAPRETASPAEPTPPPTPTPAIVPTAAPQESSQPLPESPTPQETEAPARQGPTDEEVLAAYREASSLYAWFAGYDDSALMLDFDDALVEPERTLYRVKKPGVETLESLRANLKNLFSDEIVDALLPVLPPEGAAPFQETPDGLYALPAGREPASDKGATLTAVLWPEGDPAPTACTVRVTVELLDSAGALAPDSPQIYDFTYAQVGEKWVFTNFDSIF